MNKKITPISEKELEGIGFHPVKGSYAKTTNGRFVEMRDNGDSTWTMIVLGKYVDNKGELKEDFYVQKAFESIEAVNEVIDVAVAKVNATFDAYQAKKGRK